jgi:hypothetical protein
MVRQILEGHGFTGSGTIEAEDPTVLTDSYQFSSAFRLTDAYTIPGPAAFSIQSPFAGNSMRSMSIVDATNELHTHNFECAGLQLEERYTIDLPATVKVLALPSNIALSEKNLSYHATYAQEGHKIIASRKLQDRTPTNVCTPADAAAAKSFAAAVRHDLRAQVLYR